MNQEKTYCKLCKAVAHDDHHLVHRSQEPGWVDEVWNRIRVCRKCHDIWHYGTAKHIVNLKYFWSAVHILRSISAKHYERFKLRMMKGGVEI